MKSSALNSRARRARRHRGSPRVALLAMIACLAAFTAAACAPPDEQSGDGGDGSKKIVAIFYTKTLEYYNTMYNGMADEAEERGYDITAQHANFDVNEQQELFRNALATKPDGILLGPMQADAWAPVLQEAADADVPVVIVANDVPEESRNLRLTQVGVSNYDAGEAKAKWIVEQLDGKGEVIIIHFLRGHPYTEDQRAAYKAVFADYPDIKVVEGPYATSAEEAVGAMENALSSNPNPDAVFFDGDDDAIGGLQALKERGLTDIVTASSDGTVAAVDAVKSGQLGLTVSILPYQTGTSAVAALADYLEDDTEPEDPISFPPLLITKDTVTDVPPEELGQDR